MISKACYRALGEKREATTLTLIRMRRRTAKSWRILDLIAGDTLGKLIPADFGNFTDNVMNIFVVGPDGTSSWCFCE